MAEPPFNNGENGFRDPATGRWLPGKPGGPGRPRGFDIRKVAQERAEATGVDLEGEVWLVMRQLIAQAKNGDVPAARLVLDRLAPEMPAALIAARGRDGLTLEEILSEKVRQNGGTVIQVVTGVPEPCTA